MELLSDGTFYQTKTTLMSLARRPHEIVLWVLNDSCGSSHVRTDAQTKMKSDLSMLLHHALHWAVYETSQFMRLWYLSHMQPAKAQTSLCTSAQSCQGHKYSHTRNVDEGACLKMGLPQQLLAFR